MKLLGHLPFFGKLKSVLHKLNLVSVPDIYSRKYVEEIIQCYVLWKSETFNSFSDRLPASVEVLLFLLCFQRRENDGDGEDYKNQQGHSSCRHIRLLVHLVTMKWSVMFNLGSFQQLLNETTSYMRYSGVQGSPLALLRAVGSFPLLAGEDAARCLLPDETGRRVTKKGKGI